MYLFHSFHLLHFLTSFSITSFVENIVSSKSETIKIESFFSRFFVSFSNISKFQNIISK